MTHRSCPSTAIVMPHRRGLSDRYIQAGFPGRRSINAGAWIYVDWTRWISEVPVSLAPIAFRIADLPPSHPTRYAHAMERDSPVSRLQPVADDAVLILNKALNFCAVEDSNARLR